MIVKTIDTMTLEELADTYICSRYGKDPTRCIDCEKIDSCLAGKRAIELLEEMTSGKNVVQKKEPASIINRKRARDAFKKALKSGDPVKYYIDVCGVPTLHAARERVRLGKKKYPDLLEEKAETPEMDPDENNLKTYESDSDEEVSLDAFLNEHSDFRDAIEDVEDISVANYDMAHSNEVPAKWNDYGNSAAVAILDKKKGEYLEKKNAILEKIFALKMEVRECDDAIATIDGTIELLQKEITYAGE